MADMSDNLATTPEDDPCAFEQDGFCLRRYAPCLCEPKRPYALQELYTEQPDSAPSLNDGGVANAE